MSLCCCIKARDEDEISLEHLPYDMEIPVKSRKQTDLPCLVILVIFFSFLVICVSVAGSQGDIRRFIYDYDDRGNLCGFKNTPIDGIVGSGLDLTEEKFLQVAKYCALGSDCKTEKQCVKKCKATYNPTITSLCIMDAQKNMLGTSILELIYSDLSLCWREIIVLCFCSIGLSGLVLILLRVYTKTVIKIIIVIISLASFGLTVFTWVMVGVKSAATGKASGQDKELRSKEMLNWIYLAAVFTVFSIVFFFMLFKIRNKLQFIVVLFEEGGKCIKDIPMMLLQPVLTHLITAVFACFVCIGVACLFTSGKPVIDMNGKISFPIHTFFQITSWILFFAFLWLSQFFLACQNLVIAGTVSSWYFSRIKGKLVNPIWRSFRMIVKHHLGSAAFGSLLIAIIKAIRFITKMMERKSGENGLAALLWGILQCLLACLESIVRILNKSAYVMIALFGEPFCRSARRAFACIISDSSKVALIIGVGTFILTSIELLITASVTFAGIAIFMNIDGLQIFWIPASVVFVLSYLCCHCIFSVYEMTIDTLILCFCVDHQMNDGLDKPYYMNKNLMILLNDEDGKSDLIRDGEREHQNMHVIT